MNLLKKLDKWMSQREATANQIVKPIIDWEKRALEIYDRHAKLAQDELDATNEIQNSDPYSLEIGEHSLLIMYENHVIQIPFPIEKALKFIPGEPNRVIDKARTIFYNENTEIHYSDYDHDSCNTRWVGVPKFYEEKNDRIEIGDGGRFGSNVYSFSFGTGRRVYDILVANMFENA